MVTLRCTKLLLDQLHVSTRIETFPSTTALGDWYAHLLYTRPTRLIICVSERSLLPVLIPAKGLGTLGARFRLAVADLLQALGASQAAVDIEMRAMEQLNFGPTASRRVLGSLNDFVHMLKVDLEYWPDRTLLERQLHLSATPCRPIEMRRPSDVALELVNRAFCDQRD